MSSFLDFSAKVGQSEAPSSLITRILRPRMPPMALIWSMASCSAWMEPVSEIAMVPVAECSWPTTTSVSVTASLVVLTWAVGWAKDQAGRSEEHTSELQSQSNLVCRLLLEKKKKRDEPTSAHTYEDRQRAGERPRLDGV